MVARPISTNGRHTSSHHIQISEDLVHDTATWLWRRNTGTADVTHLKPFYYDPLYITPLNIATKEADENVFQAVTAHDFGDPINKLWLVQWFGFDQAENTWENHSTSKRFIITVRRKNLMLFYRNHTHYTQTSNPNKQRRTPSQFDIPEPPLQPMIVPANKWKRSCHYHYSRKKRDGYRSDTQRTIATETMVKAHGKTR